MSDPRTIEFRENDLLVPYIMKAVDGWCYAITSFRNAATLVLADGFDTEEAANTHCDTEFERLETEGRAGNRLPILHYHDELDD